MINDISCVSNSNLFIAKYAITKMQVAEKLVKCYITNEEAGYNYLGDYNTYLDLLDNPKSYVKDYHNDDFSLILHIGNMEIDELFAVKVCSDYTESTGFVAYFKVWQI